MNKVGFKISVISMTVILDLFMLLFFILPESNITFDKTLTNTKKMISANDADIENVLAQIRLTQNSLGLKDDTDTLQLKFSNAVILGDSIAEGLVSYRILDENVCIGKRGARIDTIDADFKSIVARNPKYIFLEYGLNDLGYCRGNVNLFIEVYEEKIDMIRKALPNANIYINGILPIDDSAIQNNSVYENYIQFNEELIKLCRKKNCVFIDNSVILNQLEVKYEFDGLHPKYDYYALWAANMANIAGL